LILQKRSVPNTTPTLRITAEFQILIIYIHNQYYSISGEGLLIYK